MYAGPAISGLLHLGLLALALAPSYPDPIAPIESGPPVEVELMTLNEYNAALSKSPKPIETPPGAPAQPTADLAMNIPTPTSRPITPAPIPEGVTLTAPPIEVAPKTEAAPTPEDAVLAVSKPPAEPFVDERALQDKPVAKTDIIPSDDVRIATAPEAPEQPRGVFDAPDIEVDPDEPPEQQQVEDEETQPSSTDVAESAIPRREVPPKTAPLPRPKPRGSLAAETSDEETEIAVAQSSAEQEAARDRKLADELAKRAAKAEQEAEAEARAAEELKAEQEMIAAEEAEIAAEDARLEKETKLAEAKAEADRIAAEDARLKAESEAEEKTEAERVAAAEAAKLEAEEKLADELEAEKLAKEKADARRLAEIEEEKREAEEELAALRAAEKLKKEQEEADRLAAEEAERQAEAEIAAMRAAEEEKRKLEEERARLAEELKRQREQEELQRLAEQQQIEQQRAQQALAQQRIQQEQAALAQRAIDEQRRREQEALAQIARQQQLQQFNAGSNLGQQTQQTLGIGTPNAGPVDPLASMMAGLDSQLGTQGGGNFDGRAFTRNVTAQQNAPPLTQGEQQNFLNQLSNCWALGSIGANIPVVEMRASFTPDGRVSNASVVSAPPGAQLAVERAKNALRDPSCQPFSMPRDKFASWQQFDIVFDPRRMSLR